jgi:hypothetical protein
MIPIVNTLLQIKEVFNDYANFSFCATKDRAIKGSLIFEL